MRLNPACACGVLVGLILGLFLKGSERHHGAADSAQIGPGSQAPAPTGGRSQLIDLWDAHYERRRATIRETWNSLLLLMTFAEATAATLVATALQVNADVRLVVASCVALGAGALWIVVVLMLDRTVAEDGDSLLSQAAVGDWSTSRTAAEMRVATIATVQLNEGRQRFSKFALFLQLAIAIATGVLAVLSVLR